jgi:NifU-like protein
MLCYKEVMWEYTEKVRELFLHPKNVGEIKNADATGEIGSIICGDALKLTLSIDRNTDRISDARFQTFGCASAIASSSALTEIIKGKTLNEALKVTNNDIADFLGGLPREKMHCSVMGQEALETAINNFRGIKKEKEEGGEIVCNCFDVSDEKIRRVVRENSLSTAEDVTNFTKAGGGCGECVPIIESIIKEVMAEKPDRDALKPEKRLTNIKKIEMIREIIDNEVRPHLLADGGDIELIDVEGSKVIVSLRGMCTGCLKSGVTIMNIEKKLREHVSRELHVEEE